MELRLERPEAKNAIGKGMLQGLRSAIEEVEADAAAKVVLVASSVPKVFCAGADLKVPVASAGSSLLVTTLRFVICAGTEYLSVAAIAYCLLSCYSTCAVRLLFSRRPIVSHFECLFVGELLYFAILIKTNLGYGSMFLEAEL